MDVAIAVGVHDFESFFWVLCEQQLCLKLCEYGGVGKAEIGPHGERGNLH